MSHACFVFCSDQLQFAKASFSLFLILLGYRGRGLFPTFSLINHSCVRNARHLVSSDERLMEVVAQTDIKAGEEINVRYTAGVLESFTCRQETISSQWHFTCSCSRCSDPTEMSTFSSSFVCNTCRQGE